MSEGLSITKMHGLGNSQILIDDTKSDSRDYTGLRYNQIAEGICNEGFGVGSDQVLIILESEDADYRMRIFNKDGSEAEMCGNGIRCVGKYLYDKGMVDSEFSIETLGGIKKLEIVDNNQTFVKVDMGYGEIIEQEMNVKDYEGTFVNVGNPHYVIFDKSSTKEMALNQGPLIEEAEEFEPDKTNVEFARIRDEETIELYVWERGAGLTLACGTGACATAFAGYKSGLTSTTVNVELLGGSLRIRIEEDDKILMIGPASYVLEGKVLNISDIFSKVKKFKEKK